MLRDKNGNIVLNTIKITATHCKGDNWYTIAKLYSNGQTNITVLTNFAITYGELEPNTLTLIFTINFRSCDVSILCNGSNGAGVKYVDKIRLRRTDIWDNFDWCLDFHISNTKTNSVRCDFMPITISSDSDLDTVFIPMTPTLNFLPEASTIAKEITL